jgi:hypothetical protein
VALNFSVFPLMRKERHEQLKQEEGNEEMKLKHKKRKEFL